MPIEVIIVFRLIYDKFKYNCGEKIDKYVAKAYKIIDDLASGMLWKVNNFTGYSCSGRDELFYIMYGYHRDEFWKDDTKVINIQLKSSIWDCFVRAANDNCGQDFIHFIDACVARLQAEDLFDKLTDCEKYDPEKARIAGDMKWEENE